MAWSTRELAELAGTTVNTVRYYHRLGLLDQPEREDNGYKQYQVHHLVTLLRIRRLAALGVPLAQIEAVSTPGDAPGEGGATDALLALDRELAASIERLQQAREGIAAILRDHAPADVPAGFEAVASRLSSADSSMIHIYSQLYDAEALADVRAMVETDDDPVNREIDALPADADDAARQRLVDLLVPTLAQNLRDFPWLSEPESRLSKSVGTTQRAIVAAVVELYNPAQLDVLARASILAAEIVRSERENGA
ncbi:MerR family transcriptional regulator [Herbiconiux moechotypicola]|uniref:MerR family transcriptional regulator n=1 Tax=Herbiconiux moechotypicola TaxID=637393 RepID=A0ABN3DXD0_9MICO|nr:MerR family transcriptional regulator [Herbiconiux moechotypicola]MCS5730795.1 MerR family transcriptional regulator [Herbiconiux moechotypicola]